MCLHSWFRELKPFPHTLHITLLLRAQSPPSRDARRCRSKLPADEEPRAPRFFLQESTRKNFFY